MLDKIFISFFFLLFANFNFIFFHRQKHYLNVLFFLHQYTYIYIYSTLDHDHRINMVSMILRNTEPNACLCMIFQLDTLYTLCACSLANVHSIIKIDFITLAHSSKHTHTYTKLVLSNRRLSDRICICYLSLSLSWSLKIDHTQKDQWFDSMIPLIGRMIVLWHKHNNDTIDIIMMTVVMTLNLKIDAHFSLIRFSFKFSMLKSHTRLTYTQYKPVSNNNTCVYWTLL